MALRAKKATYEKSRLKMLLFGRAKVGKTTACLQFPNPYYIDSENGCKHKKYIELLNQSNGEKLLLSDLDDLIVEVKELMTVKHDFKTLVIDSITIFWEAALQKSAEKQAKVSKDRDSEGVEFSRHKPEAIRKMKHLLSLLFRIDMNVIVTAHIRKDWDETNIKGNIFDGYEKLEYLFDTIMQIEKRGNKRFAIIRGSRLTEEFPEDDSFEFSYQEIENRYGKDLLVKGCEPAQFVSKEKLEELEKFINFRHIDDKTLKKWLSRAQAENLSEFTEEQADKCIEMLKNMQPGDEEK